jgi:DivIVA domain-containing protein
VLGVSIVLFVVLLAVLFAVAAVTAGFGDLMKPVFQDARPVGMPEGQVTPNDLDALRFNVVLRGYKMAEVDAVLHRLSRELGERDAVLAELRGDTSFRRAHPIDDAPTELLAPLVLDSAPTYPEAPAYPDPAAYPEAPAYPEPVAHVEPAAYPEPVAHVEPAAVEEPVEPEAPAVYDPLTAPIPPYTGDDETQELSAVEAFHAQDAEARPVPPEPPTPLD